MKRNGWIKCDFQLLYESPKVLQDRIENRKKLNFQLTFSYANSKNFPELSYVNWLSPKPAKGSGSLLIFKIIKDFQKASVALYFILRIPVN